MQRAGRGTSHGQHFPGSGCGQRIPGELHQRSIRSGGAIYNDGNTFTLELCGSTLTENTAYEGGGAIFFVSNDLSGNLRIDRSLLSNNPSLGFENDPSIFVLAGEIEYIDSVIE